MSAITFACGAIAVSAEQATLQWTDNSSNEDGFYVERAANGGDWTRIATVEADVTTYIDASVIANDVYQYRVNAFNSFGTSGYTNTAVFEIVSLPPTIAALPDLTVEGNSVIAPIAITLADPDTAAEAIELTVLSSSLGLLDSEGIAITGSGADRALQLTPVMDASGVVTVTLVAFDGRNETQTSFTLTINEPVVPTFQFASIVTNASGLVPNGQSVSAQISTDRPDLLERVEYWIDNTLVATASAAPFSAALLFDQEGEFNVVATGFLARSQIVVTDSLTIAVAPEPIDSALVQGLRSETLGSGASGSTTYSAFDDSFALQSSGGTVAGVADAAQLSYVEVMGDASISARLYPIGSSAGPVVAGITLRSGSEADSAHISVVTNEQGELRLLSRISAGALPQSELLSASVNAGIYVRLRRVDDAVSVETSSDGATWSLAATRSISFGTLYLAGLQMADTVGGAIALIDRVALSGNVVAADVLQRPPSAPLSLLVTELAAN